MPKFPFDGFHLSVIIQFKIKIHFIFIIKLDILKDTCNWLRTVDYMLLRRKFYVLERLIICIRQ